MKTYQGHKIVSTLLLFIFTTASNASMDLTFNNLITNSGSIEVDVTISGLGFENSPSLATYDLDVMFDNSHLSFANAVFGDSQLGNQLDLFDFGFNPSDATLIVDGVLNIYEVSLDEALNLNELQVDSFVLATLNFNILKSDTSQLSLVVNDLSDADANLLSTSIGLVNVSTVPVPAAFWLMLSSLMLLCTSKARYECIRS